MTAARTLTRKRHQDDEDQSHPQQHVVLDRVDGQLNKIAAVVIGPHFYVGRQNVFIELLGLRFDALQHVLRLLAAPHHDDALDGVIGLVESEFAQARGVADGHFADVADAHRHAILRADDDVADVRRYRGPGRGRERNRTGRPASRIRLRHWNC